MNLEKAIEIKQLALDTGVVNDPDDFREADKLSIEALDLINHLHEIGLLHATELLPSETKE